MHKRQSNISTAVTLCLLLLAWGAPSQAAQSIQPKVRLVLVGDSIVVGWGKPLRKYLSDEVVVTNLAVGGRSSKSFMAEGSWQKALALKPDYILIEFGHNDQPGHGPQIITDPQTSYRQYMTRYVEEALAAGIQPVLVTSLSRREWDANGKINSSLQPYVKVVAEIAAEKRVPLVDLHRRSIELYEKLGRDKVNELSNRQTKGNQPPVIDNSHLNDKGSELAAQIVAEELKNAVPALAQYVK
jgi:lysophospholipase L1-like esterase